MKPTILLALTLGAVVLPEAICARRVALAEGDWEITPEGEPIEAEIVEAPPVAQIEQKTAQAPPQSATEPAREPVEEKSSEPLTLEALKDMGYTPEQIMQVNDMNIPFTTEECEAVLAKLEGRDA